MIHINFDYFGEKEPSERVLHKFVNISNFPLKLRFNHSYLKIKENDRKINNDLKYKIQKRQKYDEKCKNYKREYCIENKEKIKQRVKDKAIKLGFENNVQKVRYDRWRKKNNNSTSTKDKDCLNNIQYWIESVENVNNSELINNILLKTIV